MGYYSNLAIQIQEAMWQGATVEQVAHVLGITDAEVRAVIQQCEEADNDPVPQD